MNNFKTKNINSHKEMFDLSDEIESIGEDIQNAFNEVSVSNNFRRSTIPLYKTVFLHFVNIAMGQFSSIRLLCSEGYAFFALPILRSLLENLVSAKYVLLDEDGNLNEKEANLKALRFEEYRWVSMGKMLRYWKCDDVISQDLQEGILSKENEILDKVKIFKETFKAKDLNSWSGLSLEGMAKKVGMLRDYDLTYRSCCGFSHPSFLGMQSGVVKSPGKTVFSSKPSADGVILVLESAIIYFHEFLFLHNHLFSLGMTDKLKGYQQKAVLVYGLEKYITEINAERNDSCHYDEI